MQVTEQLFERIGKTLRPNEIIFCEYEPGDEFYLIHQGRVKLTRLVDKKEKTLDILDEGDIFGEMAILEGEPRSATAIAYGKVKLLSFNKENFETIMGSHPQLALKLLKIFSKRIFEAQRRLQMLSTSDLDLRVMDALMMLCELQGTHLETQGELELETDNRQLASWCAISENEARTILAKYQNMSKVKLKAGRIIINNVSEMNRYVLNKRKSFLEKQNTA